MAEPQQVSINVPIEASRNNADRSALAQEIIDFIRERSQAGIGAKKTGRGFSNIEFPEYSEAYIAKKGQSNVDLTLSEEMLSSIKYFPSKSSQGSITIGFNAGTKVNAKAEGNAIGSYGGKPNRAKARPFLGITKSEILRLL